MVFDIAEDLVVLVTFAGDQDDVAGLRLRNGLRDGGAAIRLDMDLGGDSGIGSCGPYRSGSRR